MNKIIVIIFLIISQTSFGQRNNVKVDFTYLTLGTLSDEMGRTIITANDDKIDSYYKREENLTQFLFENLKSDYQDLEKDDINNLLKSKKLSKKLNLFYSFEYDNLLTNEKYDSIFIGKLNSLKINTKIKQLSFISGVFIRNGVITNNQYKIQLFNSTSKYLVCEEILKKLKCKNVKVEVIEAIPYNNIVYFEPSKELLTYIKKYENLTLQNNLNSIEK